ncbi:MAG: hypothetical protein GY804_09625 [Alphaproteobacteria bacterium]|nr:hypothetical protein [Alphaproteobacteria bacterium]
MEELIYNVPKIKWDEIKETVDELNPPYVSYRLDENEMIEEALRKYEKGIKRVVYMMEELHSSD